MTSVSKQPIGNAAGERFFYIVYNARAGRKKERVQERIEAFFTTRALPYAFVTDLPSFNWGEVQEKREAYYDVRFVAAGGDGTLRLVFQGLWEHDLLDVCSVAFIPLGSANVTALSMRLPFNLTRSLRRAVNGIPQPIDLGLFNRKHIFFIAVSFGALSRISVSASRSLKKRFGGLAYLIHAPVALFRGYRDDMFTMSRSDDAYEPSVRGHSLVICNHLSIAGIEPARGIAVDDAHLHALSLHNTKPLGLLKATYDFYAHQHNTDTLRHSRIQHACYTLEGFTGIVHLDGDELTDVSDTFECRVLPRAAKLVI